MNPRLLETRNSEIFLSEFSFKWLSKTTLKKFAPGVPAAEDGGSSNIVIKLKEVKTTMTDKLSKTFSLL